MEEASAPLDILKSDSETNTKTIDRGTSYTPIQIASLRCEMDKMMELK